MRAMASSDARAHLYETFEQVVADREPVVVTRCGRESVVILALDEYEAMLAGLASVPCGVEG
ncbi:type II toxin-antitoxin system Phd/YefM family antitoxin [Catenulispora sp. EB89]|uniref:type II toxin-antitoxin system Phd/YefM family antitoxin n=1 Tax=Catenulispora sp. EB89 TaxID=3156257 RepID=UPI003510DEAB